jgi:hypothetical protein
MSSAPAAWACIAVFAVSPLADEIEYWSAEEWSRSPPRASCSAAVEGSVELGAAEPQPPRPEPMRRDLPSTDGLVQCPHRRQPQVRGRLL